MRRPVRIRLRPPPSSLQFCHCIETGRKGPPLAGFSDPGLVGGCLRSWICRFFGPCLWSKNFRSWQGSIQLRITACCRALRRSLRSDVQLRAGKPARSLICQDFACERSVLRRRRFEEESRKAPKLSGTHARTASRGRLIASTVARPPGAQTAPSTRQSKRHQPDPTQRPRSLRDDTNTKSDRVGMHSRRSDEHN